MKALLTPAILTVAALLLVATLVLTCAEPLSAVPNSGGALTKPLGLPSSSPVIYPSEPGLLTTPLPAGSNQLVFPFPNTFPTDPVLPPAEPPKLPLLARQPEPERLAPGVYQTYPWTIILVVPGTETQLRYFEVKPDTHSPMLIIKPHVEVVPKS